MRFKCDIMNYDCKYFVSSQRLIVTDCKFFMLCIVLGCTDIYKVLSILDLFIFNPYTSLLVVIKMTKTLFKKA